MSTTFGFCCASASPVSSVAVAVRNNKLPAPLTHLLQALVPSKTYNGAVDRLLCAYISQCALFPFCPLSESLALCSGVSSSPSSYPLPVPTPHPSTAPSGSSCSIFLSRSSPSAHSLLIKPSQMRSTALLKPIIAPSPRTLGSQPRPQFPASPQLPSSTSHHPCT